MFLLVMFLIICGVSASQNFEGHVHETHGHKTSSEHGEEREEEHKERKIERKGISFVSSSGSSG